MKTKLKLLWLFYRSTLPLSFSFSLAIGLFGLLAFPFLPTFSYAFMFGGSCLAFIQKEWASKGEYCFYQNKALSKVTLLSTCFIINIIIGTAILHIIPHE